MIRANPRSAVVSLGIALAALSLTTACSRPDRGSSSTGSVASQGAMTFGALNPGETPEMRNLIRRYANEYQIPESLLHRMIQRESGYNPGARNGPYYGLLQIHPRTAQTMGFSGPPEQLLDPEVNLRYAGKYLRGAWMVSDGSEAKAEKWYASGYYYEAKRRGVLSQTGLKN